MTAVAQVVASEPGPSQHTRFTSWFAVTWLPGSAVAFLVAGGVLHLLVHDETAAHWIWDVGLIATGAPIVWRTARGMIAGRFASDLVAALSIVTAFVLGQPFAGLVIVLMQSGGEALERYAAGRASAAVRALEEAAPRHAHRVTDQGVEDVPAEWIAIGDTLLVRPGDLVPCDSVVIGGHSHVDTSRLTGEPMPVRAVSGVTLMSGSANGEGPLTVRVTAISRESQYARIVDLVRSAQSSKAPLQRLADRYAVWFTPLTLLVCGIAYLVSRDPIRVLAVLVVATPCPLILAAPVAIIGGINRAARRQIIVRHGGAIEQLASVTVAVFDKTGTLTIGRPRIRRIVPAPGLDTMDVLRGAAAVEHGSSHLLARTVVEAAEADNMSIPAADDVVEAPGQGVSGLVEGVPIVVGSRAFVSERCPSAAATFAAIDPADTALRAYVAIGAEAAGLIEFADEMRSSAATIVGDLDRLGVHRVILLSGDQERYTQDVAIAAGIHEAHGGLLPADKDRMVRELTRSGERVVMVGDGTNDAPALSSAAVGVALAGHGGGITAEAADVVFLVDDVSRIADAVRIGRSTVRIAKQSIWAGLGLSGAAMVCAVFGLIPPTFGAMLQELIDVAVIVNALRASRQ
ncbi:MAG TPA: heavy metal translocating P-type ATPase [Gemmatimonadaceae bacterium]|nr:heavy metal translocating P-type ATPase [Gemmatimonadaceae bacterium]